MRRMPWCCFFNKWIWRYQWSFYTFFLVIFILYNASSNSWVMREQKSQPCAKAVVESQDYETVMVLEKSRTESYISVDGVPGNSSPYHLDAHIDVRFGRYDSSREYKLFDNAAIGANYGDISAQRHVCLATQTSLEKIIGVVKIADKWTGPISIAVFAAGDELNLIRLFILYLITCESDIFSRMSFHIVLPMKNLPSNDLPTIKQIKFVEECPSLDEMVQTLLSIRQKETFKWRLNNVYPQNHLRNLARKTCQTPFVFLVDADIVPSVGAAEGLEVFLKDVKCKMCAFVVPTYELDERVSFPYNKSELVRLAKKGLAVPFHKKVFIFNQYASNFSRWEQNGGSEPPDVHISHDVTNFELLYEPFYVASDNVPPHDERFLGYGFTRNTQVYEMFLMGYKFKVLSPIFTIHWGIQQRRTRPLWREKQNGKNRKVFETFKRELFARYRKDPFKLLHKPAPNKAKSKS